MLSVRDNLAMHRTMLSMWQHDFVAVAQCTIGCIHPLVPCVQMLLMMHQPHFHQP